MIKRTRNVKVSKNGKLYSKGFKLTEDEVRHAAQSTDSNADAAELMGVHVNTWKKYAKLYFDLESGKNYYDLLKFKRRLKVKPIRYGGRNITAADVVNGAPGRWNKVKFKDMLIAEGLIEERCAICGFCERRITDQEVPLLLMWKDSDRNNNSLDNLELVCYNHSFLYYGVTPPYCSNQNNAYEISTGLYKSAAYRRTRLV